jgi:hypothetical protein
MRDGEISLESIRVAQRLLNAATVLNVNSISEAIRVEYERALTYTPICASVEPKIIECPKCKCVSIIAPGEDPGKCPVCPSKKKEQEERKRHRKDEKEKSSKLQGLSSVPEQREDVSTGFYLSPILIGDFRPSIETA